MKTKKLLIGILAICATTARAANLNANSASQLQQALGRAKQGDTITIAAGVRLGSMKIDGRRYPGLAARGSQYVTIRSSASNPAVFDGLTVSDVRNVRFSYLKFAPSSDGKDVFSFQDSDNLEVSNCVVQGKRVNNIGSRNGLYFRRGVNLTIADNDFYDLYSSLSVSSSNDVVISGNNIMRGAHDSIHLGSYMRNLLIEDNLIEAWPTNKVKHVDLIQFTNMGGGGPSAHITVRRNTIRSVGDTEIHGIYFGNYDAQQVKGRDGRDWYSDILIEGNNLRSNQMAAIAVSYARDVMIRKNVMLRSSPGSTSRLLSLPTILVEVQNTNVDIIDNTTTTSPRAGHLIEGWRSLPIPNAWTLRGNRVQK